MSRFLNETQIQHFRASGYVAPLRVLSAADASSKRESLEQFLATQGNHGAAGQSLRTKAHLRCPVLMELVRHPAILDAVAAVLGPDILCRSSSVFLKEAHDPAYVAWHQDATYWELEPPDVVTAWVALTESTVENGAMEVLPGSHLKGQMAHDELPDAANLLSRGQTMTSPPPGHQAVPLLLAAGEMSLHHVLIAHCSKPNRSSSRRIGYAIRYVAAHVRNRGSRRDSALLVRGVDRFGHFNRETSQASTHRGEAARSVA